MSKALGTELIQRINNAEGAETGHREKAMGQVGKRINSIKKSLRVVLCELSDSAV